MRYQLRKTPELAFHLDDSLDYLENIDNLPAKGPQGRPEAHTTARTVNVYTRVALRYLFSEKTPQCSQCHLPSFCGDRGGSGIYMAIVCVLSVFNGFTDLASEKISQLSPALRIEPVREKAIADADSLCAVVTNVEGCHDGSSTIEERALHHGPHQMPVTLKGVTPDCMTY